MQVGWPFLFDPIKVGKIKNWFTCKQHVITIYNQLFYS